MRNGQFIIDAHCHVYPDKIAVRAVAETGAFYGVTENHFDGTVSLLLRLSAEAGVDHYIVQSVATSPRQVRSINEFIARTEKESGGVFTGLGTLHPDSEDQRADVRHLYELGLHGVKLHPDIQGFPLDGEKSLEICALCEEFGLPLLLHTGDKRYDYSNPNRLIPVLDRFKRLTVIGAHLGGWSIWKEASAQLKGRDNLWFDCSSTFWWIGPEAAKEIIRDLGTDRVLFGTDYPMWEPKKEVDTFFSMGLTEQENRQILSENAKRVFGLHI